MSQDRTNPSDEPTSTFQPDAEAPSYAKPSTVKPSLDKAQAPAEPTQSFDPGPYGQQPDHGRPAGPPPGQSYGQGPDQQYGQQPYTPQQYGQPAYEGQGGHGPQQYPPAAYGQQPAYGGGYPQPYPPAGPPTNTLAIIALIASFLISPLGIILGIIARNQIKRTGEGGDGLALAGIIIGAVLTAIYIASIVVFVIAFATVANTIPNLPSDYPFPTN